VEKYAHYSVGNLIFWWKNHLLSYFIVQTNRIKKNFLSQKETLGKKELNLYLLINSARKVN